MLRCLCVVVFGLSLSGCAVGDASADDPTLDVDASRGGDVVSTVDGAVREDAALTYDATATGNHIPDAGARDAADIQDSAERSEAAPDTGTPDTGTPDTGPTDGGCAISGYSGVLATFDLGNQPGGELSAAPTSTASGVSGSSLSRSSSLVPNGGSGSINSSNWPASFDASRYYTFSITPSAGCTLSLTTLSLQVRASASGPSAGSVATSADTFAARQAMPAIGTASIALGGASGASAIEVRIYGYGASSATGTFRLENTLTLAGTIR